MYPGQDLCRTIGIDGGCCVAPPSPISTINWNCRGLGNPQTVHALQQALHTEALQLVFLMETKLSQEEMQYKKQELGYTQGLEVSSNGQSRGLALLWKSETMVVVQGFSRWHINAHITCNKTGTKWRMTGFYGHPVTSKREETWSILESLDHANQLPWLCIGDYNEIVSQSEKFRGQLQPVKQLD